MCLGVNRPVFDDPVVLASFRAVANQQHSMTQIVGVTVGLLVYSFKENVNL